jgi:hypothetical protein
VVKSDLANFISHTQEEALKRGSGGMKNGKAADFAKAL